jgi:hypothetical protein
VKRPPEMSHRQFVAALKRNGFRHAALFWFEDTSGRTPGASYSGIFTRKGKTCRRATIAHLIRQRDAQEHRDENSIRSPGFRKPNAPTVQELS